MDALETIEYVEHAKLHKNMWWDRCDPYAEIQYQGSLTNSFWDTISLKRQKLIAQPDGAVKMGEVEVAAPVIPTIINAFDPMMVAAISVMHAFQHISTIQLAAFLDITPDDAERLCNRMFAMGIVKAFDLHHSETTRENFGRAWNVWRDSWSWSYWLSQLTPTQYALVTMGSDPIRYEAGSSSLSSLRHNLILTDIALKAYEVMPGIAGWWSDRWIHGDDLANANSPDSIELSKSSVGDGGLVTKDGTVVVFELVGSRLNSRNSRDLLAQKVVAWGNTIAQASIPIKLVFINSSVSSRLDQMRFARTLEDGLEKAQGPFQTAYQTKRMEESIFWVDYRRWFPSPRAIATNFLTMESVNLSSGEVEDVVPLSAPLRTDSDIVTNTLATLWTPRWMMSEFTALE